MAANTGRTRLRLLPLAWVQSPGFAAITLWRLAQRFNRGGAVRRFVGALIWRYGVVAKGCHISLAAEIGPGLRLPHPVGVVIGDGVMIGSGVTLYQNVTLGLRREDSPAYPTIGDGARIHVGAVVVGGVVIGAGARVGACSLVTQDVPAGAAFKAAPIRSDCNGGGAG